MYNLPCAQQALGIDTLDSSLCNLVLYVFFRFFIFSVVWTFWCILCGVNKMVALPKQMSLLTNGQFWKKKGTLQLLYSRHFAIQDWWKSFVYICAEDHISLLTALQWFVSFCCCVENRKSVVQDVSMCWTHIATVFPLYPASCFCA